jgi:signal transduction histidine kinase
MLLQHLGLVPALSDYVRQWSAKSGITVSLQLAPEIPQLPPDAALALFRVVQESLTNVAKYAHAKSVSVLLREEANAIAVTVIDDGTGIPPERLAHPTSHGIAGMQQRVAQFGGNFAVESAAGRGTRIRAAIPLDARELASAAA